MIRGTLCLCAALLAMSTVQDTPQRFGQPYSGLDERRQHLVQDWVARFNRTTGQAVEAGPFYDEILSLSTKTTFDAVTHALKSTALTDAAGASLGDALSIVERVDAVAGEVPGAKGDRQFRMYVRLTPKARETLEHSREFKRGADNTVFHKGYPVSFREQGGTPSIQVSLALDGRRADIDVDYRSSSFPSALFNGHLSSANSDVRAGNNADRHSSRWTGLQSWWRSFFGIHLERTPEQADRVSTLAIPKVPRAGKQPVPVMANDFLNAWLVEGDVVAAMGYVSERASACLAQNADDGTALDRGMAPFQIMANLKAAHDAVGTHASLAGLTVGVRLATPSLKVVNQPHHAQFVVYEVPDDIAAAFDCENRLDPPKDKAARVYGNYFGSTFYVGNRTDQRVALLWGKDNGYWKIVSWKIGIDDSDRSAAEPTPEVTVARIKAEPGLPDAARDFLEAWLIRKDYDAAFRHLSPQSYPCYDVWREAGIPASSSNEDAGLKIRASLERTGGAVGSPQRLADIIEAADSVHPAVRVMDHPGAAEFSLTSIPTALGEGATCEALARNPAPPDPLPLVYGEVFGTNVRFRTGGDGAVLRLVWRKDAGAWRITSYGVIVP